MSTAAAAVAEAKLRLVLLPPAAAEGAGLLPPTAGCAGAEAKREWLPCLPLAGLVGPPCCPGCHDPLPHWRPTASHAAGATVPHARRCRGAHGCRRSGGCWSPASCCFHHQPTAGAAQTAAEEPAGWTACSCSLQSRRCCKIRRRPGARWGSAGGAGTATTAAAAAAAAAAAPGPAAALVSGRACDCSCGRCGPWGCLPCSLTVAGRGLQQSTHSVVWSGRRRYLLADACTCPACALLAPYRPRAGQKLLCWGGLPRAGQATHACPGPPRTSGGRPQTPPLAAAWSTAGRSAALAHPRR